MPAVTRRRNRKLRAFMVVGLCGFVPAGLASAGGIAFAEMTAPSWVSTTNVTVRVETGVVTEAGTGVATEVSPAASAAPVRNEAGPGASSRVTASPSRAVPEPKVPDVEPEPGSETTSAAEPGKPGEVPKTTEPAEPVEAPVSASPTSTPDE
ncbi:hypothetical protein [Actinoplanes derwentensis]|uniref:Uncharacterized protein n=1 Tax=Actinoplanes derwentensis TaxID=113562 RepID=A0A1H1SCR0_9ACTN|nr:hypothetical protein [Actinoplanes derwentensis]GID83336.1 hypothetical protein Ade03nite_22600 [Actinoplanes derwentensis]SDS45663.1 hypothetical protein SAMN04489716_0825 [Actinoplanes derwentensis]